nr:SDR family oxidoreductase [Microlunatus panaciterrae]
MSGEPASAVVTGAANGIGRAIAEELLGRGHLVVGLDRDQAALTTTRDDLGDRFVPVLGDVSERAAHEDACATAQQRARLQVWVNNAGIEKPTSAATLDDAVMRAIIDVNLIGTLLGCSVAVAAMREQGGSIVNMSSIHSLVGFPESFVYASTKGGIDALTRQLAIEEAHRGIRCNAVRPGAVNTPLTQSFLDAAEDPDALLREYAELHPIQRLIEPVEIARVVAFLASPDASFINGESVTVDGGATARCFAYPPVEGP